MELSAPSKGYHSGISVEEKQACKRKTWEFLSSFFDSEHNLQLSEWEINLTSFIGEMSCLAQPMIQTNDSQINSD